MDPNSYLSNGRKIAPQFDSKYQVSNAKYFKIKFKRCKNDLRCNNLIVTPKDFQRSRNWDMALRGRSQTTFKYKKRWLGGQKMSLFIR